MSVPNLNTFPAAGVNLDPNYLSSLPVLAWMVNYAVSDVNQEAQQWLLAQGWQVVGTPDYDQSTTPPTPYYNMQRQGMANAAVLQSLVNTYTDAYNEGRSKNALRYDNIVQNWSSLITAAVNDMADMTANSNSYVGIYLTTLNSMMSIIETDINTISGTAQTAYNTVLSQLTVFLTKLTNLENSYPAYQTQIQTILTQEQTDLAAYLNNYTIALTQLAKDFTNHLGAIQGIEATESALLAVHINQYQTIFDSMLTDYTNQVLAIDTLQATLTSAFGTYQTQLNALIGTLLVDWTAQDNTILGILATADTQYASFSSGYSTILGQLAFDYVTHQTTATGLLQNLGVAQRQLINENRDTDLANENQLLVTRGMYTSGIAPSYLARNTTLRNRDLIDLNDKLNRELWENEHRLYEQLIGVRKISLDGTDRIYVYQREVTAARATQIHQLYGQLQSVRDRTLAGQQGIYQMQEKLIQYQTEVQDRLYAQLTAYRNHVVQQSERVYQISQALNNWLADNEYKLDEELRSVRLVTLDGINKQEAHQQEVERNEQQERDRLFEQLTGISERVIAGEEKYTQIVMQNNSEWANIQTRLLGQLLEVKFKRLQGQTDAHVQEMDLMKYRIDDINGLVISLFGFEERRNDSYPDLGQLTTLCVALGDQSSGWVTP